MAGSGRDRRNFGRGRSVVVSKSELAWLGKQSLAVDRYRRRYRMDDDAQRLGCHLAHPEAHHSVDERKRGKWNADAGEVEEDDEDGLLKLTHECDSFASVAVLYGCG